MSPSHRCSCVDFLSCCFDVFVVLWCFVVVLFGSFWLRFCMFHYVSVFLQRSVGEECCRRVL